MSNPTVPDFTELGARKLADLLDKGFVITGVCFERQVDGTQPQRGFVDFAGFVGWYQPVAAPKTPEQLWTAFVEAWRKDVGVDKVVNIMGGAEKLKAVFLGAAHGVADMKGGQDVDR